MVNSIIKFEEVQHKQAFLVLKLPARFDVKKINVLKRIGNFRQDG